MPSEITKYTSWNIENFSGRKAVKDVFRDVDVPYWIAILLEDMGADMIGIMEVTLASGAGAVKILEERLNDVHAAKTGRRPWVSYVSDRSVPEDSPVAKRADKYALLWDSENVDVSHQQLAAGENVNFADRVPLYWLTTAVLDDVAVNCLLWHAPQPRNHERAETIKKIAALSDEIETHTGNRNFLISGDFNYDTSRAEVYESLTTARGFTGLFNGERTTLTSLKSFLKDEDNRRQMIFAGDVDDAFLASAYDNVFLRGVNSTFEIKVCVPYVILQQIKDSFQFQIVTRGELQRTMENAKLISDHMPLVLEIEG